MQYLQWCNYFTKNTRKLCKVLIISYFCPRHLIPCSHVMVSQRRAVKDLDLYGKSSERFLSLRPSCLVTSLQVVPKVPEIDSDRQLYIYIYLFIFLMFMCVFFTLYPQTSCGKFLVSIYLFHIQIKMNEFCLCFDICRIKIHSCMLRYKTSPKIRYFLKHFVSSNNWLILFTVLFCC